jgi:hypothetical protein
VHTITEQTTHIEETMNNNESQTLGETVQEAVSETEQQAQVEQTQGEQTQDSATGESGDVSDSSTTNDDGSETQAKPKKGFEKRISKVVSERDRARQELEYWKDQALKTAQGQTTAPQQQVGQYQGKPVRDMYENDDQYLEALSDFKIEQRLNERDLQRQQATLVENYNTRAKEFAKERPDFFDIIDDASDLIIAPETAYIIQKSEVGPKLALHLAENPDVADKLNRLDATTRVYELGKLEMTLTSPVKKGEVKRVSTAPAPITSPKGSAPGPAKDLYDPTLSTAEWIALRSKRR